MRDLDRVCQDGEELLEKKDIGQNKTYRSCYKQSLAIVIHGLSSFVLNDRFAFHISFDIRF